MPATAPWSREFLRSHGVRSTPEAFAETVRKAIEAFPRTPVSIPDRELSETELEALESVGFNAHPKGRKESPIARAAAELAVLVDDSLSVKVVATMLAVDESRVRQRVGKERSLYGFLWEGEWKIPRFQFTDTGNLLPHLKDVMQALPEGLHPLEVHRWFTLPSVDLYVEELDRDVSPRDWLLLGRAPDLPARTARYLP